MAGVLDCWLFRGFMEGRFGRQFQRLGSPLGGSQNWVCILPTNSYSLFAGDLRAAQVLESPKRESRSSLPEVPRGLTQQRAALFTDQPFLVDV